MLEFIDLISVNLEYQHRSIHRCIWIHLKYVWALKNFYCLSCIYKTKHCANISYLLIGLIM